MNVKYLLGIVVLLGAAKSGECNYEVRDLTSFVNTRNGGLCTAVAASLPFGSIMVAPGGDSGDLIYFSNVNTGSAYKYGILAVGVGKSGSAPAAGGVPGKAKQSWELSPAYSFGASESGVKAEVTAAAHTAIYRISYPASGGGCIIVDPKTPKRAEFDAIAYDPSRRLITGRLEYTGGWYYSTGIKIWYAAQASEEPTRVEETNGVMRLYFKTDPAKPILFKLAVSLKSPANAERYLAAEIKEFDFESQRKRAGETWNRALSAALVDDPRMTDSDKRTFYTAVYRTMLGPKDRTGDCPWDHEGPYYDDHLCIWDTFRTELPWLTLVRQSVVRDIVLSFLGVFRRYGYAYDAFLGGKGDMIQGGDNVDVVIADAIAKKIPGIDAKTMYEILLAHATKSGRTPEYRDKDRGLVPFGTLKRLAIGASGKTMEFAYNDFCTAQVAGSLGLAEDRRRFGARSEQWAELWNTQTESRGFKGFIQSRDRDGNWKPTAPFRSGIHPFCPHFYECDSWTYSHYVPHQVSRLIELCGGPEAFVARLASYGEVCEMENEPQFLLPYLFIYASRPDLAPKYTRKIWSKFHEGNTPGDEDSGAMSSWYLFTTMGFFPNAGQDVYLINGPCYRKLTLQMENGKKIIIEAKNAGRDNIHVRSLNINGVPWNQAWFTHDRITDGATLTFEMTNQPTDWAKNGPLPPSYRFAPTSGAKAK
jgi:predicted alpha-1,2-mannosidase